MVSPLITQAPDFWSWRTGVFYLNDDLGHDDLDAASLPTEVGVFSVPYSPSETFVFPEQFFVSSNETQQFVSQKSIQETLHDLLQQDQESPVVAITGRQGIGKTELAVQYAWHYREAYSSGVVWLTLEKTGLVAEIVAFCQTYWDLQIPQDLSEGDQTQFCWSQWRSSPGPVLVILDGVLDTSAIPEALLPQSNHFRILVTTRWDDWNCDRIYLGFHQESGNLDHQQRRQFLGRQRELKLLQEGLAQSPGSGPTMVAIVGMAGVGQTELALHYGKVYGADYAGGVVSFGAAGFGENLRDWLQVNFSDRDLRYLPSVEQQVALGWQQWQEFCGPRSALIIIDDVTDYQGQVQPYLPPEAGPDSPFHFLLTSRLTLGSDWPEIATLPLGVLGLVSAVDLLVQAAGEAKTEALGQQWSGAERKRAEGLCLGLGRLPFAITWVGGWMGLGPQWDVAGAIEALTRCGWQPIAPEANPPTEDEVDRIAQQGVNGALRLSWEQLAQLHPEAQMLARVLTLLPPVDLAWELVVGVVAAYGEWLAEATVAVKPERVGCLGVLLGWARLNPPSWEGARGWVCERLDMVDPPLALSDPNQTSSNPALTPSNPPLAPPRRGTGIRKGTGSAPVPVLGGIQDPAGAREALIRTQLWRPVEAKSGEPLLRLHPLVREFLVGQWRGYDRQGWQGTFCKTISDLAATVPAEMDWETAATFHYLRPQFELALAQLEALARDCGDPVLAKGYKAQAQTIKVAQFRLAYPVLFETTFERGQRTHDRAKVCGDPKLATQLYGKALADYQMAVEQARQAFPQGSLQLAGYLYRLAEIFRDLGRYRAGIPPMEEALEITKNRANPKTIATYLNLLAELYHSQGRYEEAEPLYRQSLELRKHLLGEQHPDVATSLNNLAALYESQGRYEEAEPLNLESLELLKQLLGEEHPDVATSLNNLAALYRSQGRYEEAEPLYRRSLELLKQLLGEEHPHVANSLHNLAQVYQFQGRYEEAEPLYHQSLELLKQLLGEEHPHVANSLHNLAGLYKDQGRYEEAEPLYCQSLELGKQLLGEEHPHVANSLNSLALLYESQGRYEEAEPLLCQALELRKQLLGEGHPSVAASLNNLAGFYADQGRYEETEPLYLRSLEISRTRLAPDHPRTQTHLNNFTHFLRQAISSQQTHRLSDHPTTQALLGQLQDQDSQNS
jgi:tetratricopeptide (TPR) repeat protein